MFQEYLYSALSSHLVVKLDMKDKRREFYGKLPVSVNTTKFIFQIDRQLHVIGHGICKKSP